MSTAGNGPYNAGYSPQKAIKTGHAMTDALKGEHLEIYERHVGRKLRLVTADQPKNWARAVSLPYDPSNRGTVLVCVGEHNPKTGVINWNRCPLFMSHQVQGNDVVLSLVPEFGVKILELPKVDGKKPTSVKIPFAKRQTHEDGLYYGYAGPSGDRDRGWYVFKVLEWGPRPQTQKRDLERDPQDAKRRRVYDSDEDSESD